VSWPRGVTFDVWSTLLRPEPDRIARSRRLHRWLDARGHRHDLEVVTERFGRAVALHTARWHEGGHLGSAAILRAALDGLSVDLPDEATFADLLREIEEVEPENTPRLTPGAAEVLPRLRARGLRLGVVSDTTLATGRVLRGVLAAAGVLGHFEPAALVFSDEVGVPKPRPEVFRAALAGLDLPAGDVVHVGDLRRTDVAGARAAGMYAVRYTGCADDQTPLAEADAVISDLRELPALLDRAAGARERSGPLAPSSP
jgi:putative hydrolase of the HAD superfamily